MAATRLTLLFDGLCIVANGLVAFYARIVFDSFTPAFGLERPPWHTGPFLLEHLSLLFVYVMMLLLWCKSEGLYAPSSGKPWQKEARAVLRAVSLASLTLMVVLYLTKTPISRFMVLASWGLNAVTLVAWRGLRRQVTQRRVARGEGAKHVLIVGAEAIGQRLASAMERDRAWGVVVKGFLDDHQQGDAILGRVCDLDQVVRRHFIDEVIVTLPSEQVMKQVAAEGKKRGVAVKMVPPFVEELEGKGWQALDVVGDVPVIRLHHEPIAELGLIVKRLIDVLGAVVGLVLFAPVMGCIALAIKWEDGGPILYRPQRVGRKGHLFTCYKFRTMMPYADALKDMLQELNERRGPLFKITNDPRLTHLGRFLRKYSLDELPQFFNVLKGEMSLVGPRPPTPDEVEQYVGYTLEYYRRLDVRPGMTSLWALKARNDPSFERAFTLDCTYIESWSLWLDLKILFWTIPAAFFRGEGR
ncbi:MAG TPA: sugar transferase [Candidatus Tectomicrobia bacterium]|nr:sugar transferase [Candidatus Tectomicrobia bacterium]